jgi:hypothetical protein
MIGSLVVLLPSESKGGALVIEHHDEKVSYRGSPNQLVLVAFYADCRHEVRPVGSGYRAALTFNLFLDAAAHRIERPASKPVDTLIELVRDYFVTPRPARGPLWTGSPYTLVLTKTRALFTRDATERATWTRDLAWLRENAKPRRRMRARRK